jgi:DNA uptake protein ComE-like DNA-binding protein
MKFFTPLTVAWFVTAALLLGAGVGFAAEDKGRLAVPAAKAKEPSVIAPPKPFAPIDINSARKDEFKKLNGMTEADADRIIAGRPFGSKYLLVSDKIISEALFQAIKAHIVAKQPDKKKPTKPAAKQ